MARLSLALLLLVGCSNRKEHLVIDNGEMTIKAKATSEKYGYRYTITDDKRTTTPSNPGSGWEIYTTVELNVGDNVTISKKENPNDAD